MTYDEQEAFSDEVRVLVDKIKALFELKSCQRDINRTYTCFEEGSPQLCDYCYGRSLVDAIAGKLDRYTTYSPNRTEISRINGQIGQAITMLRYTPNKGCCGGSCSTHEQSAAAPH
jgi:hypothetical protein